MLVVVTITPTTRTIVRAALKGQASALSGIALLPLPTPLSTRKLMKM